MKEDSETLIQDLDLKYIYVINKYDKQLLTFAYNNSKKVCYNIYKNTIKIPVNYNHFFDKNGNFIE